jgi:hypothetical protein
MPDIFAGDWAKIVSVSFTVVPFVWKYRGVLAKITDILAEGFGLAAMVGGLYLYTDTLPQMQTIAVQLSADPSPSMAEFVRTLSLLYYGSVGLMGLGGLVSLFGLIGRFTHAVTPKPVAPPPKRR